MGDWMDRVGMALVWLILLLHSLRFIHANVEGDALNALKGNLTDPNNVLESWDSTLVNPCTWYHVTCDNSFVTRVDLGNSNLSGTLVPDLKVLKSLKYLELFNNHLTGIIPSELGELTSLISMDLYNNSLIGVIPDTLGNLKALTTFRLNNNKLNGSIPQSLANITSLQILNLSSNNLSGVVPMSESFAKLTPLNFKDNPYLCYRLFGQCIPW